MFSFVKVDKPEIARKSKQNSPDDVDGKAKGAVQEAAAKAVDKKQSDKQQ